MKFCSLREIFQFSSGNNIWYIQASILKFSAYFKNLEVFSNGIQLELFNTIPKLEILQQKEVSSSILILSSKIEKKKKTKKCQNLACILKRGTSWNKLEPPGMSWNYLERAGIRWSYSRLALERVRVVSCSGSCQMLPCIRQEIWGNLTITQTCRASKAIEF